MRRPWIILIVFTTGVGVLIGIAALVFAFRGNPLDPFDDRRFASASWKAANAESKARMARSALHTVVPGMSTAQVIALLGPADDIYPGSYASLNPAVAQTYSYSLGSWPIGGFDDTYFYVHLDINGRVVSTEIGGH